MRSHLAVTGHQPVEPDKGPEQAPKDEPAAPQHKHPRPDEPGAGEEQ